MDIKKLIKNIPWEDGATIRILWLNANGKPRSELAESIKQLQDHIIFPIILRSNLFLTSNALMADLATLISGNEQEFKALKSVNFTNLTVVIISNEPLSIPQASSPVYLPEWFPILGGKEIFVKISDVFETAELAPLNSEGARIEQLASLLFDTETLLVNRLKYQITHQEGKVRGLIDSLRSDGEPQGGSTVSYIQKYENHLASVSVARAYRPGAKSKASLLSKLIYQVIKNSPDATAAFSKKLASALSLSEMQRLKPSLFSVMLRPSIALTVAEENCHAGILAFYQAYQLMNAAAHASEYPSYPAALVLANAKDLARFLTDFRRTLEEIFESHDHLEEQNA
ncbi:hypothetical protein JLK41_19060 [Ectopseudomonas khazarica]|uniref:hypothetical protein n=1 Tax=Ectopseudomonas khazarica TaxID=2502979 RepID=UPI001AF009A6|nr:hypothetical protein [Pseudomonas khazarica]QTS85402.1 hypothetical protein JLK41_19060 [Pseudomonas khazarica]